MVRIISRNSNKFRFENFVFNFLHSDFVRVKNLSCDSEYHFLLQMVLVRSKSLSPKAEIWTAEKLPFLKTDDCVAESFEDSGIAERLNALLENLENR